MRVVFAMLLTSEQFNPLMKLNSNASSLDYANDSMLMLEALYAHFEYPSSASGWVRIIATGNGVAAVVGVIRDREFIATLTH